MLAGYEGLVLVKEFSTTDILKTNDSRASGRVVLGLQM
jgi:hypothetical protein